MSTEKTISQVLRRWHANRHTFLLLCAFGAAALSVPAFATPVLYNAGQLTFATQDQSMWGPGNAAVNLTGQKFYGAQWNASKSFGGFASVFGLGKTGAEVSFNGTGRVGVNFGYTVDSGSVNASAGFDPVAILPGTNVKHLQLFNIGTVPGFLDNGTMETQSPNAQASMTLIANMQTSLSGEGCIVGDCSSSTSSLPGININQELLKLTPNELEILPGVIPNGADDGSVTHVPLLGQEVPITLPVAGESVKTQIGTVTANAPDIATKGGVSGPFTISSTGSDKLLTATLDVTDLSAFAGYPTNASVDLDAGALKLDMGLHPLDINIGPQLSVGQNFDLNPTLMVNLAMSRPVDVAGDAQPQTSWQGPWDDLPTMALFGTTTFTPTFWIDAPFTNVTSLELGLVGTWDLLKFDLSLKLGKLTILNTTESLSGLLGLSDELFKTGTLDFPIWTKTFQLGGFNQVAAAPFTITVPATEPPATPLFLLGLGGLAGLACWRKRCARSANV